ncbi:MAG TPA: ATP-binding protein [Allosphingosinicella sp.]|nr:ATP-binding protein [Allosphingosinicella sp.]
MNAPFVAPAESLCALALAALRALCAQAPLPPLAAEVERLLRDRPAEERLAALAGRFGLSTGELLAAALCLAAETDPQAARLVAAAQAPVGGARPLAGLLAALFAETGLDTVAIASGAAARAGLIVLGDEPQPLTERSVSIPAPIVAALSGRILAPDKVEMVGANYVALPESFEDAARAYARRLAAAAGPVALVLRSPSATEAETAAAAIAGALGLGCADIGEARPADHACWLAAAAMLPLVRAALGPGDMLRFGPAAPWDGPILVIAGAEGVVEAPFPVLEWSLPLPSEEERAALWRAAGLSEAGAARAARTYRQGAGRIAEIAARLPGTDSGEEHDWPRLVAAVDSGASRLDTLARRSRSAASREDLVLPAPLARQLDLFVDRIRLRNALADDLGPAVRARYRPGVRALFTGESGTGKTLAAAAIARQAGLPLYRVDLAAMTSKWIGETEKNVSTVLDAAQHADVVLFFDEADSLFGARTEVSDSHDRFANAQTNYLLQRIEDFDGVAILASNSRDRFDPAFARRLDFILSFPLPDAAARRALWTGHLGTAHALSLRELDALALHVDLAGGHIRNIVLAASVRAQGEERAIHLAHVAEAVADEYAKLGRSPPPLGQWQG